MKILFNVYNISGYLVAELRELVKSADVTVIEVPWEGVSKLDIANTARWIDRRQLSVADMRGLSESGFDAFFCGGWTDKKMVCLARGMRRCGTRTVLLIDTPWQGKIKQYVHCLYSRVYLTTTFDFAWGAGEPQERYLRYLGFPMNRIRRGYYCADTEKFSPVGEEKLRRWEIEKKWPHAFLYVGRYVAVKNMRRMERAFLKALDRLPESDWKLKCIGGGALWDERTIHPRIEHLGYKTPDQIQDYVQDTGCFVLPSVSEPWGVVVHEAALMGLPIICSSQIQAATAYLKKGVNGYLFDPLDEESMVSAFCELMSQKDEVLADMGSSSHKLGLSYIVANWAQIVREFASETDR